MDAIANVEACPWGFLGLFAVVILVFTMLQQAVSVFPVSATTALTNANDQSASVRRHGSVEGVMSLVGLSVAVGQATTQHRRLEWCGWMHMVGVIYPAFLMLLGWNIARTCRSSRSSSTGKNIKLLPGLAVVVVAEVGRLISATAASSISPDGLDLTAVLLLALLLLLNMQASFTHYHKKKKAAKKKIRRKATTSRQDRKNEMSILAADNADDSMLDALLGDNEGEEDDETVDEAAKHSPLDKAGLFSRLAFSWVTPLLRTGARRQLHFDDIPPLAHGDDTSFWAHRFQDALDAERDSASQARRRPSLLRVAKVTFGAEYFYFAGLQLFNDLLGLTGPILLKLVVTFVQDFTAGTATLSHGYALFVVLLVCYGAAAVLSTQYSLRMSRVQLHVRTALTTAIYHQLLRCRAAQLGGSGVESLKEKREKGGENKDQTEDKSDGGYVTAHGSSPTSTGGITNLMTVDVQRIQDAAASFNTLWSLPLQVGLTLFLLYREVSYAFIAGLVVLATMVPINAAIARAITRVSQRQMKYKDSRVQACDEMLHGIRTLKLLAWEDHLARLLGRLRGKELQYLARRKYLDAWCVYFWAATPVVTSLVTFVAVVQLEHTITPAAVFTTIALLNMLIFPMNAFPWVINGLMEARVSKGRLERFLLELPRPPGYLVMGGEKEDGVEKGGREEEGAEEGEEEGEVIGVEAHGSFAWNGSLYSRTCEEIKEQRHKGCKQEIGAAMQLTERLVETEELEEGVSLVEASFSSTTTRTAPPSAVSSSSITIPFSSSFELPNLHLRVAQGEIVGIYGKIGAGKSTLLGALLGELYASPGSRVVLRASRRAYVAQSPWLQRGSIRDNIVFGQPWDGARFEQVLEACALLPDLATISGGAQAEIGERGGTLSGGQRLRVALARALYSRAELYLLDDPFSGLDTHTAQHVAQGAVFGMMRQEGATVVLVTHALPLLEGCDWAVAMQEGRIVEKIRFKPRTCMKKMGAKMVKNSEGDVPSARVHRQYLSPSPPPSLLSASSPPASSSLGLASALPEASPAPASPTALAQDETREEGHVKWGVISHYINSTGRLLSAALLTCLLGMQLSTNAFTYWLSLWSSHTDKYTPNDFLIISGSIAALNSAFTLSRSFLFAYGGLRAARLLHDQLLCAIVGASIVFFDAHPVGRILNRFAQDIYTIDDSLPFMLNIFLAQAFGLFGTALILLLASPWSVVVLLVVAVVYQRLQIFYRASSRELKRLDSVSRSPVFAHFSETMDGATTIRAFGATDSFLARCLLLVDANQRVSFAGSAASQWLGLRLQASGVLVVASVAAWAVGSCVVDYPVSAGLIGLSLSYTLPLVGNLSGLLSAYSETEKEMVAVERVHEFTCEPPERDVVTLGGEKQWDAEEEVEIDVPSSWPSAGRIVVQDLSLRYRPTWPLALDHVNLTIQAGEKIGICGRTGSGKTTLLSTLFRLVPWQGGSIFIEGLPIHRVPLQRLRASLAIIPQSPTLFAGSVRSNLDPTDAHSDAELGVALKTCHLDVILRRAAIDSAEKSTAQNKEETPSSSPLWSWSECLAVEVQEKGQNFSVGERQLLCLCRVLLRRTPIVCVDEASASLDVATDALLRRTLAKAFEHATVITIAHRMSTVLELCERVVVLSEGRVVEDGDPKLLVRDSSSFLARLALQERMEDNGSATAK
ncbi:multidrug resistance-associated protein 7 [Nannochloropsis oceanica]